MVTNSAWGPAGNTSTGLCGEDSQIRSAQFIGPVTAVGWNTRSLWAHGYSDTIEYTLQLLDKHDITVLAETRETPERRAFLDGKLPKNVKVFSSGIDQYRGGVAVILRDSFLQYFEAKPRWTVIVQGRLARLELRGAKGTMHVYAIYLDPECAEARNCQMRRLAQVYDEKVLNIIIGDFNFVTSEADRISKSSAECHNNAGDKLNAKVWNNLNEKLGLKEFIQEQYTCENSFGWSRIDRAYTNLHTADICLRRCAASVLQHPRGLSDHFPLSISLSSLSTRRKGLYIPPWVTAHSMFKAELTEEYKVRCEDFRRCAKRLPDSFEKLDIFKESAHVTTSYIRRICKDMEATSIEHRLSMCLSFIRAIYARNYDNARQLQRRCSDLVNVRIDDGTWCSEQFLAVKTQAVALMHADIQERTDELRQMRKNLPAYVIEQKKKGIACALKKMLPGGSSEISAMNDSSAGIVTSPAGIAECLNNHWQRVLDSKNTDQALRMEWLEELRGKFRVSKNELRPTRKVVRQIIKEAPTSASGPDAVPFAVYKAAGEVAVTLFLEAALAMLDGNSPHDENFNLAFMVCIPKKAESYLADMTPVYSAAGTRPISIVDAANRILASIFCKVLETAVGTRLNYFQKGFLKDRHMLRNVLDIDLAAHKISIKTRTGAILLFDFTAAFPSLAHEMIWDVLQTTGIDESFINVVRMFYDGNRHLLKVMGRTFKGVHVRSGVRQGCPLSGLLFSICVDVLLSKIEKQLRGNEAAGAFADDIAVVVEDFWRSAPALQKLFAEFQRISALALNVRKTVMIPLWPMSCPGNVRTLIKECCAQWADFAIEVKGKYLGFLLGPGSTQERWNDALAKFEQRVKYWAGLHLGMALNIVAFNIYILPVLEFSAQLFEIDAEVVDKVLWGLRRLAPGPGTWTTRKDLENLKLFGFRSEARSLEHFADAAKLRIIATIASDYFEKCRELDGVCMEYLSRPFLTWHNRCYYKVLQRRRDALRRDGVHIEEIRRLATVSFSGQCRFQRFAMDLIRARAELYDAENRIRAKVKRWKLHDPPAHVASRILANLQIISRRCRPCVVAMMFRTLWNGWPTSARMRFMPEAQGMSKCVLGCNERAEDRIEHYLICPRAWTAILRWRPGGTGLDESLKSLQAMLLAQKGLENTQKAMIAVAVYAIARTVQTMRTKKDIQKPEYLVGLFLNEGMYRF